MSNTLEMQQQKFYRAMAKTLKVYTLYGSTDTLSKVISRLVEHDCRIHYSGEFLYESHPWDEFLDTYCQDIKAELKQHEENWHEGCLIGGYKVKEESDTEISIYIDGNEKPACKVYTCPLYLEKFTELLSKLCRFASFHGTNLQFMTLPKRY